MQIKESIDQAYALLPHRMSTPAATVLLLAIQKQEDPELVRYQRVRRTEHTKSENIVSATWAKGPARGWPQMEENGGVAGVLRHPASRTWAHAVCLDLGVPANSRDVWLALETNDVLSAAFARLLLWTDSQSLPTVGDVAGGWDCYLRTWRPGAAKRDYDNLRKKWSVNYATALDIFRNG